MTVFHVADEPSAGSIQAVALGRWTPGRCSSLDEPDRRRLNVSIQGVFTTAGSVVKDRGGCVTFA